MSEHKQEVESASLRITPVVTCFLLHRDGEHERLCLVRRSSRVGSYNARWAGISGFIEPGVSPEEQAYTELREETGLSKEQVHLLKRGEIVEYRDQALNRHWLVHPFLVEVPDITAMKLDWEAEEMRWIEPAELENYETVPRLQEAFLSASQGKPIGAQ